MWLREFLEKAPGNLIALKNVSFIIELFIMSINIVGMSIKSIKIFTWIQELISGFFFFKNLAVFLLL